jgi:hypothetical protein
MFKALNGRCVVYEFICTSSDDVLVMSSLPGLRRILISFIRSLYYDGIIKEIFRLVRAVKK